MPSILSRFKRSPSTSSSLSGSDNRHRRSSTVSSAHSNSNTLPSEDETLLSPATSSQSPTLGRSGSHFLEEFGVPVVSPSKQGKHKPEPLALPGNTNQQVLGTPKLVLTEEGSNSPRSFDSNPVMASPRHGQAEGLGIALGAVTGAQPATAVRYPDLFLRA